MQEAQPQSNPPSENNDSALNDTLAENVARLEREHTEQEEKSKPAEDTEQDTELEPSPPLRKDRPPQPKASHYAALHNERVRLAAEKQELAAQKAEIEAAKKAISSGKRSPSEAIKAMGYESMKEFLEQVAQNGGEITPEQQKIWELEERLQAREKQEEEYRAQQKQQQESAQYEAQVKQWHTAIRNYMDEPDSKWSQTLVAIQGQEPQVLAALQAQHEQYGENLDIHEGLEYALDTVNRALEKQMRQGLAQVAANPRGRALINEIVGHVTSNQRNPSRAKQNGITSAATNQTGERRPDKELTLEEMLERNTAILRREHQRI